MGHGLHDRFVNVKMLTFLAYWCDLNKYIVGSLTKNNK